MSTTIPASPPEHLLKQLRDADVNPSVAEGDRETALSWLRCVLVDFTALSKHVTLLQQLYDSPFCYPNSRRDGGIPNAQALAAATRFRFTDVWTSEQIVPVLDVGLEVLKGDELARLLLNPFALFDIHDVISETSPEAWLPVMQNVGREMMRREGARTVPTAPNGVVFPPDVPRTTRAPKPVPWRWVVASSLATAAMLLLAFTVVFRNLPRGVQADTNLVASANLKFGERGGPQNVLTGLEVTSNFDGYVTVVFLKAEHKQVVVPLSGSEQEWRVTPNGAPTVVLLPEVAEDAQAALLVVTQTPADATVRKLTDKHKYTANQLGELEAFLEGKLREMNYHQLILKPLKLPPAKGP